MLLPQRFRHNLPCVLASRLSWTDVLQIRELHFIRRVWPVCPDRKELHIPAVAVVLLYIMMFDGVRRQTVGHFQAMLLHQGSISQDVTNRPIGHDAAVIEDDGSLTRPSG